MISSIIFYLGLYAFVRIVLWIVEYAHNFYITDPVSVKVLGKWALVTGATDGIGRAYAEAFAAKGRDVILVSRTLSKLETVASEISQKYKVKTNVIDIDFTADSQVYWNESQ